MAGTLGAAVIHHCHVSDQGEAQDSQSAVPGHKNLWNGAHPLNAAKVQSGESCGVTAYSSSTPGKRKNNGSDKREMGASTAI